MIGAAREVNNGGEKPESAHIFLTRLNECENSLWPRAFPAPSADETATPTIYDTTKAAGLI